MSLGPNCPHNRGYDWFVRITVEGIDCYSVGCDTRGEAAALAGILGSAAGVQETEVIGDE